MCGRFTIISDPVAFQMEFDIQFKSEDKQNWKQRYNVSPSQIIPVINNDPEHSLSWMLWGLNPVWAKFNLINIRSETIREKTYFKKLLEQGKRCLIPADGFYEWQTPQEKKAPKVPYYFHLKDRKPFAFAGIWEPGHTAEQQAINTCAIITCPPNPLVGSYHNRMPVMLDAETSRQWLGQNPLSQLLSLLAPYPAERMGAYAVSRLVNNPKADQPECILPAD